jgi:hypothetical protein
MLEDPESHAVDVGFDCAPARLAGVGELPCVVDARRLDEDARVRECTQSG